MTLLLDGLCKPTERYSMGTVEPNADRFLDINQLPLVAMN
ncbi:hypothetical protein JOF56_009638 [Kibdelosporangium banguiense]|uniref:Uncharacterized protein n=1 Tax=Kibdelosporangium banguiense TaxID=1365924 RepID=A0ABS4TXX3_9PSEU|nr:hypothetical protein [Kibdelosporangium banguiense]